ncbi:replication initiator protein A [Agathobaculum butyriciproducens]|jgi:hypothetical protein|uniref:replication initiator protein A n=1 Tax=Agathobaculum butyriciproducens TaxID=1628085 RepID=UPI003AAB85CB
MNNSITTPNETFGQSESTQAFAKLPKVFFDEKAPQYPQYKHLTAQHILAYTLMRDRLQLSITKQMKDENGTPFIYYDLENIASAVRCRAKKAGKLVDELDKAGLIHKVRQGLGKPNLIYVYDVLQASPSNRQFQTSPADSPDPSNGQFKTRPTDSSRSVERTVQDPSNGQSNKTDKNNTEISKTDNSNTDSNDTEISKTDNSNYSVNGNERALDGGFMTLDAKNYFLARNEESLVDEVRQLLFKIVKATPQTIRIDDREMKGNAVSKQLENISIAQIETALNHVIEKKCSEEQREECLTAELYHVTQESSQQSNTTALAEISEETQVQNRKNFDQTSEESDDLWN